MMNGPAAVDGTAVLALTALLTVLTFSSGFVAVRLHDAYRDALVRQRELDGKLADIASTNKPFPALDVQAQFEGIRRSLREEVFAPVFIVLGLFTAMGIALAFIAGHHAGLRWFDARAPGSFYGLAALALSLAAITALTALDYWRLRRGLRQALGQSIAAKLLDVERLASEVHSLKRRVGELSDGTLELDGYVNYLVASSEDLAERLKVIEDRDPRNRGRDWRTKRRRTRRVLRNMNRAIKKERRSAKALERRLMVAEGKLPTADARTRQATELLDDLSARPGIDRWGYFAGLRGIVELVELYDPLFGWTSRPSPRTSRIREYVTLATEREGAEGRWWAAKALLEEAGDNRDQAATDLIEFFRCLVNQIVSTTDAPLAPVSLRTNGERRVFLSPDEPETYILAHQLLDAQGQAGTPAATGSAVWGLYPLRHELLDPFKHDRAVNAASELIKIVRSEATAEAASGSELGWWYAQNLLNWCRKPLKTLPTPHDKRWLAEIDRIDHDVIRVPRDAFNSKYDTHYGP